MNYQLTETGAVIRKSDGVTIPNDPGNIDWQEYSAWIDGGNEPDPADKVSDAQRWLTYQATAQAAIETTDMVALRAVKAGAQYPEGWKSYALKLRAIIGASSGDHSIALPEAPPYPEGT